MLDNWWRFVVRGKFFISMPSCFIFHCLLSIKNRAPNPKMQAARSQVVLQIRYVRWIVSVFSCILFLKINTVVSSNFPLCCPTFAALICDLVEQCICFLSEFVLVRGRLYFRSNMHIINDMGSTVVSGRQSSSDCLPSFLSFPFLTYCAVLSTSFRGKGSHLKRCLVAVP